MTSDTDTNEERLRRILERVRRIDLLTRGVVKETLGGQYHSKFKGQGIEFDDFREYQPGDDVRFLDWNVTARMDHPYVRKYVEERELTVILMVDVSPSSDYGSQDDSKRELAAELAAMFALSAGANGDKVGLLLFSDQIEAYLPPRKGHAHSMRLLRDILFTQAKSTGSSLSAALDFALKRVSHRALIVVLSDFLLPDTSWERSMRTLTAKHDVAAVHLSDPAELELPNVGSISLRDPESGQEFVVNSSSPKVRDWYAQQLRSHRSSIQAALSRSGVATLEVQTGQPYLPAVKAYFKNRGRARK
jgi:uncharacterized protein (DUF58 family)